jgi:hypothetical protein
MFFELVAADLAGDADASTDLLKTPRRAGADCDSALRDDHREWTVKSIGESRTQEASDAGGAMPIAVGQTRLRRIWAARQRSRADSTLRAPEHSSSRSPSPSSAPQ